jgi:hypothetical protein
MTRAMPASLPTGTWRLGALLELPRDMHCSHELVPAEGAAGGATRCAECRQVLAVLEALRNERAS